MARTLILAIAIVTLCGGTAQASCEISGWGGGGGSGFSIGIGTGDGDGIGGPDPDEDPTISNFHVDPATGRVSCSGTCTAPTFNINSTGPRG